MSNVEPAKRRKMSTGNRELQDARPLLQAIFLGIVLATALMIAAAMAGPNAERDTLPAEAPAIENAAPKAGPE